MDILDEETGRTRVRLLDTGSPAYTTARALEARLEARDLEDAELLRQLEATTGRSIADLEARWAGAIVG